jgi:hypothetical protein
MGSHDFNLFNFLFFIRLLTPFYSTFFFFFSFFQFSLYYFCPKLGLSPYIIKRFARDSPYSVLLAFSQSYIEHDLRKNKIIVTFFY